MNFRGQYNFVNLKHCKVCGMDAAARKVHEGVEDKFYVVCEVCGFKTKGHKNQSSASKEWNK